MVMNVDDESAFIMSLTENIARRKFSPLELLSGIEQLRDQGYDKKSIAQKTGLSPEYVQGILQLLQNGEQRLLMAVGSGRIPLNAAITIAGAGSDESNSSRTARRLRNRKAAWQPVDPSPSCDRTSAHPRQVHWRQDDIPKDQ
jgi:ParB-like chromosome segregation protein Spo0J